LRRFFPVSTPAPADMTTGGSSVGLFMSCAPVSVGRTVRRCMDPSRRSITASTAGADAGVGRRSSTRWQGHQETDDSVFTPMFERRISSVMDTLLYPPQCQRRARMIMIGIGTPNNHRRIPRPMTSSYMRQFAFSSELACIPNLGRKMN
jgi:hypothetical protein